MQLQVLGEVQVVGDGGIVPLGGPRQRLLLAALLARANEVVGVGHLIEAVWPNGNLPVEPDKTLRIYVTRLRKVLEQAGLPPGVLATRENGYLLSAGPTVFDAAAFVELTVSARRLDLPVETTAEVLRRALSLWQGPAFGELGADHAFLPEAQRLDELRLAATEELAAVRLALGDASTVVADLQLLVRRHPLRERLRRLLMDALANGGRQAEALSVYEEYRRLLRTELGLQPSAGMRAAEADLLAFDRSPSVESEGPHRTVRGYKLFERLGEGAFSVVYRATQPSVGRDVAVKIIRADLANRPEFIRRFEAEAQLIARLEHPNIVPLYDFWREPSRACLVMRWLRAGSLESHIANRPWSFERTARMVSDIGSALASAHRAGVVHRDVRPANILLDFDGNAYLSDFGIALSATDGVSPQISFSRGSPAYAPPEQLMGLGVGPQGDIYSLAVTVFEALAGQRPFADAIDTTALTQRQLNDRIPFLSSLRSDLPPGIDEVLGIATAKAAADRYPSIDDFVTALRKLLPERVRSPATPIETGRNPYRGLLAFHEADEKDFFGRQVLVDELLAHMRQPGRAGRFMAVVGASGSGKSSVVRAGLLPALRRGAIGDSDQWYFLDFVPGTDPFRELAAAVLRVTGADHVDGINRMFGEPDSIVSIRSWFPPQDTSDLLLVIDQSEELFTRCDPRVVSRFLDELAKAVTHETSRVRVVLTLRADFLDHPLRHQNFAQVLKAGMLAVTPLTAAELEQSIVEPARRVGVTFEDGLVAEIVADVSNRAAALPLLQFAMHQLFERRSEQQLSIGAYRKIGRVTGALAERAEQLVCQAGPTGDEVVRRIFGRLVTLGDGADDTRRRALRSELVAHSDDSGVSEALINEFGAARLLSFDRDRASRLPTVEIAHEALLYQWPRLVAWIDDDRQGLRILRQITDATEGWSARGCDPAELYRGGRLEDALSWRSAHPHDLNERELAFLNAGEAQRDGFRTAEIDRLQLGERTNHRLRRLLATVATVAALALIAGVVAVQQRASASRNSQIASKRAAEAEVARATSETRRLGVEAATRAPSNPQLALLLAAEAFRRQPDAESLGALQRALTGTGNFLGVLSAGRRTNKVRWLDNGRIAVAGADGVFVQDVRSGKLSGDLRDLAVVSQRITNLDGTPAVVPLAAFSQVRAAITVQGAPNEVVVVSLDHPVTNPVRLAHDDPVQGISFSPDGTTVATIDQAGRLRSFDSASGRLKWTILAHAEFSNRQIKLPEDIGPSANVECDCIGSGQHVVGFTEGGSVIVSVHGPVLRKWDAATGATIGSESVLVDATIRGRTAWSDSFHIDIDGSRIVIAGRARVGTFDTRTGAQLTPAMSVAPADSSGGPWVSDVAWLNAQTVLALTSGGQILRQNTADQQPAEPAFDIRLKDPVDLAVSPSGDTVAVASSEGVGLWSLRGDRLLARAAPREGATVGSLSPSGTTLTAFKGAGLLYAAQRVARWDLSTEEVVRLPVPPTAAIYRYFDRSQLLFSVSPFGDVTSWDSVKGKQIAAYDVRATWSADAVSTDGAWIVFGAPGLRVFDVRTGAPVRVFTAIGHPVRSLSFSPDRKRLAVADDEGGSVKIFDTATTQLITEVDPTGPRVAAVRYSPDGSTLAIAEVTGRIRLRDATTFALRKTLVGSNEGDMGDSPLWFSGDGRYFLSGSPRQASLWDLDAGVQIGDPFPNDASFKLDGVDGPHLLTGVDQYLLDWNLDTQRWPTIACRAAGRNLTTEEWSRFGPAGEPYAATCPNWPSLG